MADLASEILSEWLLVDQLRYRAEEARTPAGDLKFSETKETLLHVARIYDDLTTKLEEKSIRMVDFRVLTLPTRRLGIGRQGKIPRGIRSPIWRQSADHDRSDSLRLILDRTDFMIGRASEFVSLHVATPRRLVEHEHRDDR